MMVHHSYLSWHHGHIVPSDRMRASMTEVNTRRVLIWTVRSFYSYLNVFVPLENDDIIIKLLHLKIN